MPQPTQEHEWLRKFVGEWESDIEMHMEPGKPAMKLKGSSRDRMIGGFWLISQGGNPEMPFEFVLTLGYDPQRKKYIGTWTDSMTSYHWHYVGTASGNTLTLETEGPSPTGGTAKHRDVTEFKSPDLRVYTSSIQAPDGKWNKMITVTSRRKK
jgi:hypothetical protein